MNASAKTAGMASGTMTGSLDELTLIERLLLVMPLVGGAVFGILPLFFAGQAPLLGYSGKDLYLYQLSGAVTLGYVPGLLLAVLEGKWTPARLVVIATLVFNLASLFAIATAVLTGTATSVVYAILVASLIIAASTAWMVYQHRGAPHPAPDTAPWLKYLLIFLTAAAFGTGILFTFVPVQVAQMFGFTGADDFVYRQGGAALLGFAVMGVFELRSLAWRELRLPSMNALLFNGVSFPVTLLALWRGEPILLLGVVLLVSVVATVGTFVALWREGK